MATSISLTTGDDTYTSAAGDYIITGNGGNDTITTGAGNSSIVELNGNNTITMGAGNNSVHTGIGNQTITTGAGISDITTGAGNSTITTGAGGSTIHTGDGNSTITTGAGGSSVTTGDGNGNNTITTGAGGSTITTGHGTGNNTITTGAGGSTITTYGGNDTITTGAGNSVVDSGTGNDTVTTAAGSDIITYHHTGNVGNHSIFNAGTGIDTLKLVLSNGDQTNSAIQADIASYRTFLAANMGATGEDGTAAFTFTSLGLTASMFEKLDVSYEAPPVPPAPPPMTQQLYSATNGAWSALLQHDGVWVAANGGSIDADSNQHTVIRQFNAAAGTYTFNFSVDNKGSVFLDGLALPHLQNLTADGPSVYQWALVASSTTTITSGEHTLQFNVQNNSGPAGFALEVADSSNNVIWDTGHHLNPEVLIGVYTPVPASIFT